MVPPSFAIDVTGMTAIDVGSSTGGFTDVLLRRGAAHVVAVDVGYGQLAWELRQDPRVVVMERCNIRHLTADRLETTPSFFTVDCSFISLRLVLPALMPLPRCVDANLFGEIVMDKMSSNHPHAVLSASR